MAILIPEDAATIRSRLDLDPDEMDDAAALAPYVVRPVEASVLRRHPDLVTTPDVRMAVSLLVAAAHLRAQPEVTQSRLGNSTVNVASGDASRIAGAWEGTAWELLAALAGTEPEAVFDAFVFAPIRGRR